MLANPIALGEQVDPDLHERVLASSLAEATRLGIAGRDVTPFLLGRFHTETGGASLTANVALVLANARLAGEVAVAHASLGAARAA